MHAFLCQSDLNTDIAKHCATDAFDFCVSPLAPLPAFHNAMFREANCQEKDKYFLEKKSIQDVVLNGPSLFSAEMKIGQRANYRPS